MSVKDAGTSKKRKKNMNEEVNNKLSDYDNGFPATFYYYDIKDEKLKTMEVTEKAWNNTLKTFEDNDNITRGVVFKYLSKHDTVKTQEV